MNEKRGPWYLLTGAVLGIVLGLLIGWLIAPVQYVDTSPSTLRSDFKDQYRYMIAAAYSATGNLERARARLALVGDADPVKALGDQAQRMLASNTSQDVVGALADLSQALQSNSGSIVATPSPQPAHTSSETTSGLATSTPAPNPSDNPAPLDTPATGINSTLENTSTSPPAPISTATPRPTHTPTSTPGSPFVLVNRSTFCEPTQPGLAQILLQDSSGQPAAGVELVITWLGGEEHFFTGLKPELGNGYADFVMSANVEYALSMSNGGTRVAGLIAPECTTSDGATSLSGIRLEFKQP